MQLEHCNLAFYAIIIVYRPVTYQIIAIFIMISFIIIVDTPPAL